ncbi:hypothetical protein [Serratia ureilytica]|uniref:hypothetical protein n=1 Tax=Serratia ureilytica TaxID=300181 RepID=UPI001F161107|nr:hypothetical protein [Serratia ureilytica]
MKKDDTDVLAVLLVGGGAIAIVIGLSLLFSWGMLAAWNLLASSAGWAFVVPINWGTVFGLMLVIIFVQPAAAPQKRIVHQSAEPSPFSCLSHDPGSSR